MKKAVIVIPTYNEGGNIEKLLSGIFEQAKKITNWEIHVLVVDSKSKDNTASVVKGLAKNNPHLHLIETEKEGLGKAYVNGFRYAIDRLNPYLLFEMDADLSHDPKNIPEFLKKIEKGADFVYGSRYIKGGSIPKDWGLHRKFFSVFGNLIFRLGFMKLKISDWTTGYRAIKTWVVKSAIDHAKNYSGYVFQIAILDKAINNGARIEEIPIHFKDRVAGTSKINFTQYISQNLFYILSHSSFVKFVIVGFIGFFIDFGFAYLFINQLNFPKAASNALSAEIAIISNFFLNNFWSFRYKKIEGGIFAYAKKFILFNVVSSGSIFIQWSGMTLALKFLGDTQISLTSVFNISSWIVYKVFIVAFLIIPYSYILYNKVIWRKK